MKIQPKILATAAVLGAMTLSLPMYSYAQNAATNDTTTTSTNSNSDNSSYTNTAEKDVKHAYKATKHEAEDAALTTKVKAKLDTDHRTRDYTIHVDSYHDGTVVLSGEVPSHAVSNSAARLVRHTSGVTMVHNHLRIAEKAATR